MLALQHPESGAPRDLVEAAVREAVPFVAVAELTVAQGRAIIHWCEWMADGPAVQCEQCPVPDPERRRSCLAGPNMIPCIARRTGLSRFAVHRTIAKFKRFLRSPSCR